MTAVGLDLLQVVEMQYFLIGDRAACDLRLVAEVRAWGFWLAGLGSGLGCLGPQTINSDGLRWRTDSITRLSLMALLNLLASQYAVSGGR